VSAVSAPTVPFRQDFGLVVRIALRAPAHAVDESLVRAREHAFIG
jgi:hypothetical protein